MNTLLLSRIQFAVTIGFHFLFPPISIGLAWLLVAMEWRAWRHKDETYARMARFFGKLLGLTFVMGVATGLVMEFQFGTNWSEYSKFVGDIFGAPLAAEVIFAFFLESVFLGLYLYGRNKVSPGVHWFSCLMVAVGATISAFWILVAGSWMQTPAGFTINEQLHRAELTSFTQAVFNPSMWYRFFHTMAGCLVCGAFFVAGIAAYRLRKNYKEAMARGALKIAIIVGFLSAVLVAFPTGHDHAQQVARDQPEKFASIEGLQTTQTRAPLTVFGLVSPESKEIHSKIEIPGLLSWLAYGDVDAPVKGLEEFAEDERPPLWLTFVSFHNMVALGTFFILVMFWGVIKLWRKNLYQSPKYLKLLIFLIPLPLAAMQFGWVTAEVGRQPWIVYRVLRTSQAFSPTVPAESVLFSLIMFITIYIILLCLYLWFLIRIVKKGSEPTPLGEGNI